jgi:hypothetical protein
MESQMTLYLALGLLVNVVVQVMAYQLLGEDVRWLRRSREGAGTGLK